MDTKSIINLLRNEIPYQLTSNPDTNILIVMPEIFWKNTLFDAISDSLIACRSKYVSTGGTADSYYIRYGQNACMHIVWGENVMRGMSADRIYILDKENIPNDIQIAAYSAYIGSYMSSGSHIIEL